MLLEGLIASGVALIASCISCALLVMIPVGKGKVLRDSNVHGIQKSHSDKNIPRIGGLAILVGLLISIIYSSSSFALPLLPSKDYLNHYYLLALISMAFLAGLLEDLVKDVPQIYRLLLSFIAAGMTCLVFDSGFYYSGSELIDQKLLSSAWVAYPSAIFMIGGVMHGINIIDGYNGLSSGLSLIALVSISYVAILLGDNQLAIISIALIGAILGTMLFNYPWGKIFIGDGGAYLLGFVIATSSLLLINRNPEVSPWFPLMLIALPVWETLFSMFRRKVITRQPATKPDANHLHNLVHQKIVCRLFPQQSKQFHNSAVAPFMWMFSLVGIIPALLMWDNTGGLFISAVAFIIVYCSSYLILSKV